MAATGSLQAGVILSAMRPTILTVDDEPDVLELIRFHLSHAGCNVLTATSGRSALETIRAHRPDLAAPEEGRPPRVPRGARVLR